MTGQRSSAVRVASRRYVGVALVAVALGVLVTHVEFDVISPEHRRPIVAAGAVLALGAMGWRVFSMAFVSGDHWEPTDPESGPDVSTPGDRFDRLSEPELRARLRAHVVRALVAKGHSESEAERMVETGAWTDDRFAAAYLGTDSLREALTVRIPSVGSKGPFTDRIRERTIAELARLREEGEASPTTTSD